VIILSLAWGYWALKNAPLDALPDLSDTQVIIYTEWTGRSPDLVEDQITYPISSTLLAAPQVQAVRGFPIWAVPSSMSFSRKGRISTGREAGCWNICRP